MRIAAEIDHMKQFKDEYVTYAWICNMPQVCPGDEQHDLTDLYNHIITIKYCNRICYTGWNVSKYGDISGPYFPVFSLNTGKYGPETIPYLDTFHAVLLEVDSIKNINLVLYCEIKQSAKNLRIN